MTWRELGFWVCAGCILYAYAAYPVLLAALARWRGRPIRPQGELPRSVSVVIAAYNEEASIRRRLEELAGLITTSDLEGEIIVVSDGSTDLTAALVRAFGGPVRLLEQPENRGKAAALNAGTAAATGEILVFADVRQRWADTALTQLLVNFRDPAVGAVSGDLIIEAAPGVVAGVGLYWRYEKVIRRLESRLHSTVGVTGSICAVRRRLFRPIPPGTILDDVYWPLRVVMDGHRVVHEERARAFDRFPERARDEFRRKVRTLGGNFQLVARLPALLHPGKNPLWWQFLSHKLLRLVVPWALLGLLATAAVLPGPFYRAAFYGQIAFYLVALLGTRRPIAVRSRLAAAAASFLVLNTAAWTAFWVWASGRAARSWNKTVYRVSPTSPAR